MIRRILNLLKWIKNFLSNVFYSEDWWYEYIKDYDVDNQKENTESEDDDCMVAKPYIESGYSQIKEVK